MGDRLRILPGERFPADGQVERNAALVDEQVLTGESRPVLKEQGSQILGGTLNLDGDLVVRVDAAGSDSTLAKLVELVKRRGSPRGITSAWSTGSQPGFSRWSPASPSWPLCCTGPTALWDKA